MEVWKDIPGYEGIYQASTLGRIRTPEGKTTSNERYGTRHWKSRILKGRGDNYATGRRVSLWKDGKPKDFLVARLVALTFIGEPTEKFTVNHKDGNRLNNRVENLEWLSSGDNTRHGFETGLFSSQKAIYVIIEGEKFRFRSLSKCDEFLGRHKGYTSDRVKKFYTVVDSNGNEYKYILEEEKGTTDERS
jgi:hypothetical protein